MYLSLLVGKSTYPPKLDWTESGYHFSSLTLQHSPFTHLSNCGLIAFGGSPLNINDYVAMVIGMCMP